MHGKRGLSKYTKVLTVNIKILILPDGKIRSNLYFFPFAYHFSKISISNSYYFLKEKILMTSTLNYSCQISWDVLIPKNYSLFNLKFKFNGVFCIFIY